MHINYIVLIFDYLMFLSLILMCDVIKVLMDNIIMCRLEILFFSQIINQFRNPLLKCGFKGFLPFVINIPIYLMRACNRPMGVDF